MCGYWDRVELTATIAQLLAAFALGMAVANLLSIAGRTMDEGHVQAPEQVEAAKDAPTCSDVYRHCKAAQTAARVELSAASALESARDGGSR